MLVIVWPFPARWGGGASGGLLAQGERMLVVMAVGIEEVPRAKHRRSFFSYILGTLLGQTLGWVLGTPW